ncbi:hypothetical protein [Nitratiruptor sp. SB155-2]|uniref:hypothetical protein n=1 Tax=Nitratiruptor sp. (strain SB155-2) TaxID=387092 RepID=UPI0001586F52|nr:hypothetical protein [Nitratiruptor sp. SB155-2]BAF69581.1 hypothetical protein NIS_0467 [Nitratiruptor sp. SB155-2]BAN05343.1 hypothetical protein [Nitratiruptor phage NrS-1]
MKDFEKLLKNYEIDIKSWTSDLGEGHLFLAHREALIPYENDQQVIDLDKKALDVIARDKSKGSDKLFLEKLKSIIEHNISAHAA